MKQYLAIALLALLTLTACNTPQYTDCAINCMYDRQNCTINTNIINAEHKCTTTERQECSQLCVEGRYIK